MISCVVVSIVDMRGEFAPITCAYSDLGSFWSEYLTTPVSRDSRYQVSFRILDSI